MGEMKLFVGATHAPATHDSPAPHDPVVHVPPHPSSAPQVVQLGVQPVSTGAVSSADPVSLGDASPFASFGAPLSPAPTSSGGGASSGVAVSSSAVSSTCGSVSIESPESTTSPPPAAEHAIDPSA